MGSDRSCWQSSQGGGGPEKSLPPSLLTGVGVFSWIKAGEAFSSPHHRLPSPPLSLAPTLGEGAHGRFHATLRASTSGFSLDCCPNTTGAVGRGWSHKTGFIKGFPHCVYQEETTDLHLEEGPGLLFTPVSIIEIIIPIREVL